jgi:hypothetical protein
MFTMTHTASTLRLYFTGPYGEVGPLVGPAEDSTPRLAGLILGKEWH